MITRNKKGSLLKYINYIYIAIDTHLSETYRCRYSEVFCVKAEAYKFIKK